MTLPLWVQILTLATPALIAVFSAWWAARSARRAQRAEHDAQRARSLEERTAQKKYDLYEPFLTTLSDLLTPARKAAAEARMMDTMADFQAYVSVWGSDEVMEAFTRYRMASSAEPTSAIIMRLMADLLVAIRKDIAWPDTEVTGAQIIGSRMTDIGDHPEIKRAFEIPLDVLIAEERWAAPFEVSPSKASRQGVLSRKGFRR